MAQWVAAASHHASAVAGRGGLQKRMQKDARPLLQIFFFFPFFADGSRQQARVETVRGIRHV